MTEATFTERAEKFVIDLMREQYLVGAGLKENLELVPIYTRNADLFAAPTVRERIAAMNRDEKSKPARHLADFSASGYIENAIKELGEAITNAELKAVITWDEKEIPYHSVRSVLVREPNCRRRHELNRKQLNVMVNQNPMRVQRIKAQHEIARNLGFADYRAMVERLRGWDLPAFANQLAPLVQKTTDIFDEQLGRHLSAARVPRDEAETSDVAYIMRASDFDSLFRADQLIPSLYKTIALMGIPLDSTPGLVLDTEARPLKSPRAFCAPVRIPKEVYLVIKPIGGVDDYHALFHEAGHAEHFSHINGELPFELRYLGDEAISETFAFLFEHLTTNPRWLVDILRLPLKEAEKYHRFALFSKTWMLRRYIGKLNYELVMHKDGPEGMEDAYTKFIHRAAP